MFRVGRKRKYGARFPSGDLVRKPSHFRRADYLFAALGNCEAIYVAQAGDSGPLKIGRSADPPTRSIALQVAQPNHVRMIWYLWLQGDGAKNLELAVHNFLKSKNVHAMGEWFYVTPATAVAVIEKIAERSGLQNWPESYFRDWDARCKNG